MVVYRVSQQPYIVVILSGSRQQQKDEEEEEKLFCEGALRIHTNAHVFTMSV